MARNNYVKITNGDGCLIIGFYTYDGEMVDVLDSDTPFLTTGEQEMIQMWIHDGISPANYEDEAAIRRAEQVAYGKPWNR